MYLLPGVLSEPQANAVQTECCKELPLTLMCSNKGLKCSAEMKVPTVTLINSEGLTVANWTSTN